MSYGLQGFQQIAPPLVDVLFSAYQNPTSTLGNAPTLVGLQSPGGATNSAQGPWASTGAALGTDQGGTGDLTSGIELKLTCVPGTVNGLGPVFGVTPRYKAPPAGTLVLPYPINVQMVRFEVFGLHWDAVPAGTQCLRDSGVVWTSGGGGNGVLYDAPQAGAGGQGFGWGIVYHTATSQLQFVAKQISGTGGVGLSAQVDIGKPANGVTNPFYVDMRFLAPTLATPAAIQIFIDTAQVALSAANSAWGAGTNLPPPVAGANEIGFFPVISNNTPVGDTINPLLHFTAARLRIGSIAACTLENQF